MNAAPPGALIVMKNTSGLYISRTATRLTRLGKAMSVKKYRKKPVEIEAMQMPYESSNGAYEVYRWVEENTAGSFDCLPIIKGDEDAFWPKSGVSIDPRDGRMVIATLEGGHLVDLGDYVIRGVQGEFYPCKPDIFAATYKEVEEDNE